MDEANRGREAYSAWFADRAGGVLYFGLSPFWTLYWQQDSDPLADLAAPGDHLIGRFDLERDGFLPPLRLRESDASSLRGSVWDVHAHSNGRIYYTTFFEEIGYVDPATGERASREHGSGLNELTEGPEGLVYVTRYGTSPESGSEPASSVVVLDPELNLLREIPLPPLATGRAAAKSIAVDPRSGEIWVNADVLAAPARNEERAATSPAVASVAGYVRLRFSASGELLESRPAPPELLFVRFDASGRAWLAEDEGGSLVLRVLDSGREIARASLGPRGALDFAQDLHFADDRRAVLALWSGRVYVARLDASGLDVREQRLTFPASCTPPRGRALLYSAVLYREALYGTLYCGATVLRQPLS